MKIESIANTKNNAEETQRLVSMGEMINSALWESLESNDFTAAYTRDALLMDVLPLFPEEEHCEVEKLFDILAPLDALPYYPVGERFDGEPFFEVQPEIMDTLLDDLLAEFA